MLMWANGHNLDCGLTTGEYDGHAENEHFCLELARAVGLPAASSQVQWFQDQVAIVVERYDRVESGAKFIRIH
jgi:serine/threonine-protein kinase HipA